MSEICPNCNEESQMGLIFDIEVDKSFLGIGGSSVKSQQCDNNDCPVKFFTIEIYDWYWSSKDCNIDGWRYKGEDYKRV